MSATFSRVASAAARSPPIKCLSIHKHSTSSINRRQRLPAIQMNHRKNTILFRCIRSQGISCVDPIACEKEFLQIESNGESQSETDVSGEVGGGRRVVEVVVAVAATVVFGVGNRVLYKLALVPLKHYPFFLAQLATFGSALHFQDLCIVLMMVRLSPSKWTDFKLSSLAMDTASRSARASAESASAACTWLFFRVITLPV